MQNRTNTTLAWALALVMVAVFSLALLGGCSSPEDSATSSTTTVLGSLPVARSALSTAAPDAKLLLVQTATSATPTATPVWAYLFGSPSTDVIYLVYTADGAVMSMQEYGTAGLSAEQWAEVPEDVAWAIDSDEAYASALEVSGAEGDPAAYMMGIMSYKAADDTSTVEPNVWNVWYDPGTSGATTSLILVDAESGDASISEE
jgi:hypothetical protein